MRVVSTVPALFGFLLVTYAQNGAVASAAQQSTETWLRLVDNGAYSESWDTAAAPFKRVATREKWVDALNAVRSPLGTLGSRRLKSATATKTLPGAPDGDYFVFQYDARFEHKQAAVETVTAVLDNDGAWRVGGYFIK
jgi:hypothetical protein